MRIHSYKNKKSQLQPRISKYAYLKWPESKLFKWILNENYYAFWSDKLTFSLSHLLVWLYCWLISSWFLHSHLFNFLQVAEANLLISEPFQPFNTCPDYGDFDISSLDNLFDQQAFDEESDRAGFYISGNFRCNP